MSRRLPARILQSLVVAALSVGLMAAARVQDSPHLKMGNPSHAAADPANKNNFLMVKPFYALSYNNVKGTPNWVSWRLAREDLGTAGAFPFKADAELPDGFKKIQASDYSGSGFNRGHMCPHADRAATPESSKATYVMTNIVPQSAENNQRAWSQLENYIRNLVRQGKVCYIVAGPAGVGGIGESGTQSVKTPKGGVVVPHVTWKVVMVLDQDVASPSQITEDSSIRLFAAIVPNDKTPGEEWVGFRRTVAEVEALTGYTFFEEAPSNIVGPLKTEPDEIPIPPPSQVPHED